MLTPRQRQDDFFANQTSSHLATFGRCDFTMLFFRTTRWGGTNPSLVEALGAGNAVIAHDNRFNRWVVSKGAMYFTNAASFAQCMDSLIANPAKLDLLRQQGRLRFAQEFTWPHVLAQYEALLTRYLP
jgi:glycosyltransferase involved in cell wall biosynthesis